MKATTRVGFFLMSLALCLGALTSTATAQNWTQLSPTGGPPAKRAGHYSVVDTASNRMIVFGGASDLTFFVPTMFNDTWVLANADGTGGTLTWTQLSPSAGPPSGRDEGSAVYDSANDRMIVFGGNQSVGFCGGGASDVWVLSNTRGPGTPNWTQLSPTGGGPGPSTRHSAVYDPATNRMIVFGTANVCGLWSQTINVWALENANGLGGTPNWTQLTTTGGPITPRDIHSAVYDPATNRMTIFGGNTPTGLTNDVWVLSNANGLGGTPTWTQLSPSGGPPAPRLTPSAVYDGSTNRMTIFGGSTPTGPTNDVWVLSNANGLGGTPTWTQLSPSGGPPSGRDFHSAVFNPATNRMTVFAGRPASPTTSSPTLNDAWVLTDANGIAIGSLIDAVNSISLPSGVSNSLISKLQNAQISVNAGNSTAACNQLNAFIHEVSAQSGKKITVDQANQLINDANQIKATLGCP